jgi:hypothetical protein
MNNVVENQGRKNNIREQRQEININDYPSAIKLPIY